MSPLLCGITKSDDQANRYKQEGVNETQDKRQLRNSSRPAQQSRLVPAIQDTLTARQPIRAELQRVTSGERFSLVGVTGRQCVVLPSVVLNCFWLGFSIAQGEANRFSQPRRCENDVTRILAIWMDQARESSSAKLWARNQGRLADHCRPCVESAISIHVELSDSRRTWLRPAKQWSNGQSGAGWQGSAPVRYCSFRRSLTSPKEVRSGLSKPGTSTSPTPWALNRR